MREEDGWVVFAPELPQVEYHSTQVLGPCPFGGTLEVRGIYQGFSNHGKVTVELHSSVTGFLSGASKSVTCSNEEEFHGVAAELTVKADNKMQANMEACME